LTPPPATEPRARTTTIAPFSTLPPIHSRVTTSGPLDVATSPSHRPAGGVSPSVAHKGRAAPLDSQQLDAFRKAQLQAKAILRVRAEGASWPSDTVGSSSAVRLPSLVNGGSSPTSLTPHFVSSICKETGRETQGDEAEPSPRRSPLPLPSLNPALTGDGVYMSPVRSPRGSTVARSTTHSKAHSTSNSKGSTRTSAASVSDLSLLSELAHRQGTLLSRRDRRVLRTLAVLAERGSNSDGYSIALTPLPLTGNTLDADGASRGIASEDGSDWVSSDSAGSLDSASSSSSDDNEPVATGEEQRWVSSVVRSAHAEERRRLRPVRRKYRALYRFLKHRYHALLEKKKSQVESSHGAGALSPAGKRWVPFHGKSLERDTTPAMPDPTPGHPTAAAASVLLLPGNHSAAVAERFASSTTPAVWDKEEDFAEIVVGFALKDAAKTLRALGGRERGRTQVPEELSSPSDPLLLGRRNPAAAAAAAAASARPVEGLGARSESAATARGTAATALGKLRLESTVGLRGRQPRRNDDDQWRDAFHRIAEGAPSGALRSLIDVDAVSVESGSSDGEDSVDYDPDELAYSRAEDRIMAQLLRRASAKALGTQGAGARRRRQRVRSAAELHDTEVDNGTSRPTGGGTEHGTRRRRDGPAVRFADADTTPKPHPAAGGDSSSRDPAFLALQKTLTAQFSLLTQARPQIQNLANKALSRSRLTRKSLVPYDREDTDGNADERDDDLDEGSDDPRARRRRPSGARHRNAGARIGLVATDLDDMTSHSPEFDRLGDDGRHVLSGTGGFLDVEPVPYHLPAEGGLFDQSHMPHVQMRHRDGFWAAKIKAVTAAVAALSRVRVHNAAASAETEAAGPGPTPTKLASAVSALLKKRSSATEPSNLKPSSSSIALSGAPLTGAAEQIASATTVSTLEADPSPAAQAEGSTDQAVHKTSDSPKKRFSPTVVVPVDVSGDSKTTSASGAKTLRRAEPAATPSRASPTKPSVPGNAIVPAQTTQSRLAALEALQQRHSTEGRSDAVAFASSSGATPSTSGIASVEQQAVAVTTTKAAAPSRATGVRRTMAKGAAAAPTNTGKPIASNGDSKGGSHGEGISAAPNATSGELPAPVPPLQDNRPLIDAHITVAEAPSKVDQPVESGPHSGQAAASRAASPPPGRGDMPSSPKAVPKRVAKPDAPPPPPAEPVEQFSGVTANDVWQRVYLARGSPCLPALKGAAPNKSRGPGPRLRAVVVAFTDFRDERILPCPVAERDAEAVATMFELFGYEVNRLYGRETAVNREAVVHAVKNAVADCSANENSFCAVYVAGRGVEGALHGLDGGAPRHYMLHHDTKLSAISRHSVLVLEDLVELRTNTITPIVYAEIHPLSMAIKGVEPASVGCGFAVVRSSVPSLCLTIRYPAHVAGLFTWYFLKGLQGDAVRSGRVTPGVLNAYVYSAIIDRLNPKRALDADAALLSQLVRADGVNEIVSKNNQMFKYRAQLAERKAKAARTPCRFVVEALVNVAYLEDVEGFKRQFVSHLHSLVYPAGKWYSAPGSTRCKLEYMSRSGQFHVFLDPKRMPDCLGMVVREGSEDADVQRLSGAVFSHQLAEELEAQRAARRREKLEQLRKVWEEARARQLADALLFAQRRAEQEALQKIKGTAGGRKGGGGTRLAPVDKGREATQVASEHTVTGPGDSLQRYQARMAWRANFSPSVAMYHFAPKYRLIHSMSLLLVSTTYPAKLDEEAEPHECFEDDTLYTSMAAIAMASDIGRLRDAMQREDDDFSRSASPKSASLEWSRSEVKRQGKAEKGGGPRKGKLYFNAYRDDSLARIRGETANVVARAPALRRIGAGGDTPPESALNPPAAAAAAAVAASTSNGAPDGSTTSPDAAGVQGVVAKVGVQDVVLYQPPNGWTRETREITGRTVSHPSLVPAVIFDEYYVNNMQRVAGIQIQRAQEKVFFGFSGSERDFLQMMKHGRLGSFTTIRLHHCIIGRVEFVAGDPRIHEAMMKLQALMRGRYQRRVMAPRLDVARTELVRRSQIDAQWAAHFNALMRSTLQAQRMAVSNFEGRARTELHEMQHASRCEILQLRKRILSTIEERWFRCFVLGDEVRMRAALEETLRRSALFAGATATIRVAHLIVTCRYKEAEGRARLRAQEASATDEFEAQFLFMTNRVNRSNTFRR
jgi:hypothetical protein